MNKRKNEINFLRNVCIFFVVLSILFFILGFVKMAHMMDYSKYSSSSYDGDVVVNPTLDNALLISYTTIAMGSLVLSSMFGISSIKLSIELSEKEQDKKVFSSDNLPQI